MEWIGAQTNILSSASAQLSPGKACSYHMPVRLLQAENGTVGTCIHFARHQETQHYCDERVPESLTHFGCLCPKFRKARKSAHNQVRDVITSFLTSTLRPEWILLEEARMAKTGLILRSSSFIDANVDQLGRRQPDWMILDLA